MVLLEPVPGGLGLGLASLDSGLSRRLTGGGRFGVCMS
jgi:hypothetical protein